MSVLLRIPGSSVAGRSGNADACVCTALRMLSRYASGELGGVLAPHGLSLTESQLMMTLLEGPARTHALARRLWLDVAPTSRSLARLEGKGVVRRRERWRFSEWVLEPGGVIHLEVLEPVWHDVDRSLRAELGATFATAAVRAAERLPPRVRHDGPSWLG